MGNSSSKTEEDKALQLCHERRKFVRQALDGRCSLAAAHVTYIQSLKKTGIALRKFFEPEALVESSLYTSTSATPEPLALTEKSLSHFSFSSPSLSHPVDGAENFSPSPSPPSSTRFQSNHMKFRGFSSKRIEEKPPVGVTGIVTSSSAPQNISVHSTGKPESSPFEHSSVPPGTPPWDYFGLFHSIDHGFSNDEEKETSLRFDNIDDIRRLRQEEGIPELEDGKASFHESEESNISEDEFDDPQSDTLVRSFENFNRVHDHVVPSASPTMPSVGSVASETELLNGRKSNSPDLSLLGTPSSGVAVSASTKKTPMKEHQTENKISPKDFLSSMKDIEALFIKASESGLEVPRMLEVNKLHFRPIVPSKENGFVASTFFKACFSCGEDHNQVQEEPAHNSVEYLTGHRTSLRSSSSRDLLGLNVKDDAEAPNGNLFQNFCMTSGSHASTLDRLYAWERKLHDEVKASEMVRREYDSKCKFLRQLESKGESSYKIDKTRAIVKDLHSRIRVAIHRIDSISKRIEELRDKELQPQLEELIEGLSRMWEVMFECHKLQCDIISLAYINGNAKITMQSESHRQTTIHLESELNFLHSSFMKWIGAQESYLHAINNWLLKCVFFSQKPSKRNRRQPNPPWLTLRSNGPPIYVTCGVWLDKLKDLHVKEVAVSIKVLAAETTQFLPSQDKNQGKGANLALPKDENASGLDVNMLRGASDDHISGFEGFRLSLEDFLVRLNQFAGSSVVMYSDLQQAIENAKSHGEQKSQSQV